MARNWSSRRTRVAETSRISQDSRSEEYHPYSNEEPTEDIQLQPLKLQTSDHERTAFSDDGDDTSSVQSFELYTPDEEKAVLRKLDTRLVLFLALLYMLSFLDRSNIGNAKVAGMSGDLGLKSTQFEWLLTGFYISYICFEWMALLYKVFPPHAYISICVFMWGFLASLQSVSTGFPSMLVFRFLLGISEAAFGPGVPFYLSFFFRRDELAFRTGLFISAAPLASSFASSLAFAIVKLSKYTHIQSWRLLFLAEAFPSMVVAIWAWFWIPDAPESIPWLKRRERRIAWLRLRREKQDSTAPSRVHGSISTRGKQRLNWAEIGKALRDPKSYSTAAIFFSCNVAFSSMPVFAPIIIQNMGYSDVAAQGLSAPPHLFAFLVVLITATLSDRFRTRSLPIILHASCAALGYILLASATSLKLPSALQYLCLFPITAGFFSAVTTVIVWTVNNQRSDESRGSGIALLNVIGQLGPLLGTRLYPDSDAPSYSEGHAICACFMALTAILALVLRFMLGKANKATHMARISQESNADQPLVGSALSTGGSFEYIL